MAWRWLSPLPAGNQRPTRRRHLATHTRPAAKPGGLLRLTLGLSLALHAGLAGLHFADPAGFERVFRDTPLDVILVNARTPEAPQKAQALAQAAWPAGVRPTAAGPRRHCRPPARSRWATRPTKPTAGLTP